MEKRTWAGVQLQEWRWVVASGPWDVHRPCHASHCPGRAPWVHPSPLAAGQGRAGSWSVLGASGQCQERKNTITRNNCRTRVQKAPPDPSWRPLQACTAPLPAACALLTSGSTSWPGKGRHLPVLGRAQLRAELSPPCPPQLAAICSHIWLEPGLAGRSGRPGGCCPC